MTRAGGCVETVRFPSSPRTIHGIVAGADCPGLVSLKKRERNSDLVSEGGVDATEQRGRRRRERREGWRGRVLRRVRERAESATVAAAAAAAMAAMGGGGESGDRKSVV